MIFKETKLQGAYIIEPEMLLDERGAFARTFCRKDFEYCKYIELKYPSSVAPPASQAFRDEDNRWLHWPDYFVPTNLLIRISD